MGDAPRTAFINEMVIYTHACIQMYGHIDSVRVVPFMFAGRLVENVS